MGVFEGFTRLECGISWVQNERCGQDKSDPEKFKSFAPPFKRNYLPGKAQGVPQCPNPHPMVIDQQLEHRDPRVVIKNLIRRKGA